MSQAQAKESIKSFLVTNYECEMNCKLVKRHEFYVLFRIDWRSFEYCEASERFKYFKPVKCFGTKNGVIFSERVIELYSDGKGKPFLICEI